MKTEDITYFIEHKETHLWYYREVDTESPHYISTFNGSLIRNGFNFKDAWTNDPNNPLIAHRSKEEAQRIIWFSGMSEPEENVTITEHIFDDGEI